MERRKEIQLKELTKESNDIFSLQYPEKNEMVTFNLKLRQRIFLYNLTPKEQKGN
jgi:hypothetical protein